MMIYKTRDKLFDVLIKIRMANLTSVDWATQMVGKCQIKRGKEWPTTDSGAINRRNIAILKNSSIKRSF